MKKILFISAQCLPIPAVKGGAVEVLLTQLIEENEKYHQADFCVISKYDQEAKKYTYKNTKINYFSCNFVDKICFLVNKLFRKIVYNRLTRLLFKNSKFGFCDLTFFGYYCNKIAKRIKPDIIVSESYDKVHQLWPLVKSFGNENFYYHLHYTKEEVLSVRKMFPNTIAISKFVLNHWVKDESISGKNFVLYNGIDLDSFKKTISVSERKNIRKLYGLNDDDFVVLFTGRLRPHKGILELLNAFNTINEENIKLLLIGDFLSESKEHSRNEIDFEEKCLQIINSNKNIVRTGNVSYDKIPDFYHISDIQIIPSMWEEGAGLVAIEGMASGLPLIITNSGGMPEYTGNECAIILERDSELIGNLAKSILKLYSNSDLRLKMSKIGKERSDLFSKEEYYKQYMGILLKENNGNER